MTEPAKKAIPAAVLIPILVDAEPSESSGQATLQLSTKSGHISLPAHSEIVFTVRTELVEHHKGQISFPGGVFEPQDESLEATALRESFEEIGLGKDQVEIVGELPEVPTLVTGFRIRPYIGLVRKRPQFRVNADEIAEMLLVPIGHLLNPQHSVLENYERSGIRYELKAYHFHSHRIWGATAIILQTLLERYLK